MAHGDKKWIRDYNGRIKRSRDRTYKDWKGDLNSYENRTSKRRRCAACEEIERPYKEHNDAIRDEYHRQLEALKKKYPGGWGSNDYYYYHMDELTVRFVHIPWSQRECDDCKRKDNIRWYWHTPKVNHMRNARYYQNKSWIKRDMRREYRSKVKNILRKARYEEDLYDEIPVRKYNWWRID